LKWAILDQKDSIRPLMRREEQSLRPPIFPETIPVRHG